MEICLFASLSLPIDFPNGTLATWSNWYIYYGNGSWCLLPWLLLVPDGTAVFWWDNDLWWIGGLALYVLAEKLMSAGHWLGYGLGVILTLWGLAIVLFI